MMNRDWDESRSAKELNMMYPNAQLSRKISVTLLVLAEGVIIAHFIAASVVYIQSWGDSERDMYMTSYFPFDVQKSPNYEVVWIGQVLANFYGASSHAAIDGFFAALVLHLCSQFSILRQDLGELINHEQETSKDKDFFERLIEIVKKHNQLNRFLKYLFFF